MNSSTTTRASIGAACSWLFRRLAIFGVLGFALAAQAATVGITKTTNAPNPVPSGQNFTYFLSYTSSSTTGAANNVVITDVLPPDTEFVSLAPTIHVASYTAPAVGSTGTIVLTMVNPLPSGSAGIVPVITRYKAGVTPDATVSVNTATITASDAPTASSSVTTTSDSASTWTVNKTGPGTATIGASGVTYTLSMASSGTNTGQLNLQSAVMVDTLPIGVLPADVLNAAGAAITGTGLAGNPVKLTWNLGVLSSIIAQPAASKTVTIRYPSTQFADGQVVQNVATATGTPIGGSPTSLGPVNVNTSLSLPAVGRTLGKAASDTTVDIGQVFGWQLNPDNNAAVPLDNFTITDTLPGNFTLQSVFTGTGYTGAPTGSFMAIQYETTASPGTFTTWPGGPFAVNQTLQVSALGLGSGVHVTAVRMNYGTVGTSFVASTTAANRPNLRGVITNPARNGNTVPAGTSGVTSVNNAALTATYNGLALPSVPASATATINTPAPAMTLGKVSTVATPFLGQAFSWQLNPANTGNTPLNSLLLTDTLPGNYTLQSIFTGTSYVNSPGGNFITIRYKTTANSSYTAWTGGPFAANQTLPVSALGLSAGVYLTALELNYGNVPLGFAASTVANERPALTGVVNNPTPNGTTAGNGSTSLNSAILTGSYDSTPVTPSTATSTVTIPTTTTSATFTKATSDAAPLVGAIFGWQLNPFNTGTSPLDNFTITDTLPANFTLQSVFTGTGYTNPPAGNFVSIRYKTTANSSFTTWPGSPFAANTTQNVSSLSLPGGGFVTQIEINYGTVPAGFRASTTAGSRPTLTGVVNSPARDGSTPVGGTTINNTNASLTGSYGNTAITPLLASATATIPAPAPGMTLGKSTSNATPPIGQSFTYHLRPMNTGNTVLNSLTILDTLPTKFTLQSVYTGNTYTNPPSGSFVTLRYKTTANATFTTWPGGPFAVNTTQQVSALGLSAGVFVTVVEMSFGNVPLGFAANATLGLRPGFTGVVTNPARDGSAVASGNVINNPATLDASFNSIPLTQISDNVNVTMSALAVTSSLGKAASKASPAIGEAFDWQLSPANTGVVALDNFIVTDTLPSQFQLNSITTGTGYVNPPSGNFISVRYKTTANSSFTTWTGSPFAASATALPVSSLGLGSGVFVTVVEINYGTVPVGFATSGTAANKPNLTGVVNNPARDGTVVSSGASVVNSNTTLTADYNSSPVTPATASATATMAVGMNLAKTSSAVSYDFGESVIWRLRPQNTSGVPLNNFIVTDTLPSQFELTSVFSGTGWTGFPATGVFIRYTTTVNPTYALWPGGGLTGGAYGNNLTANVSALNLPAGVFVTAVQFDYGTVAGNFTASGTAANQPSLTGMVQKVARDGSTVSTVVPITNITNNAAVTASLGGTALQPSTATAGVTMKVPSSLTTSLSKAASVTSQKLGQPFDWQLTPAATTAPNTLFLNNFTITDTLPAQFELQSVFTGASYANSPVGNFITLRYKTTANPSFTTWTGGPFTVNQTLNVSSLGLGTGVFITVVEINYGTVQGNFAASATAANKPRLTGVINSPARNGAVIADNTVITNQNTTLNATFGGTAVTQATASAPVTNNTFKIKPNSVKTVESGFFVPGGTVGFQIETWNDSTSEAAMVNPVGMDLLPPQVDFVPGTFTAVTSGSFNSSGASAPVLTIIPNYSGNRTLLRWQYTGSFAANTRATVSFNVRVRQGTTEGTYANQSHAGATPGNGQEIAPISGVPDILDLNGNGNTTESISQTPSVPFTVGASPAVNATKLVKGALDKIYTKYPDYGLTVAGGSVDYKINITNVGSVNLNNLTLIDILPAVGDVGVIDTSPRLSAWTPELTGSASVPIIVPNATIYYTTEPNPNRSEVGGPITGNPPNWSTTPPADLNTVRAFKIVWDASVVLLPGQALDFNIPMRAPLNALDGTIAWNSFAWTADPAGFPSLAAEPNKVGVGALNTGKAIGNYVWLDENSDGYQDVGEPGLANVKVNLYNDTGAVVGSTWTDSSGHYLFKYLEAKDFFVRVDASTLPPGVTQTTPSTLANSDFGNQDQSTGPDDYGYFIPATNNGADLSGDFGYNYNPTANVNGGSGTCMLGDRVWLDLNGDGRQTSDEMGISGVSINLLTSGPDGLFGTADDVTSATTTTDSTGRYLFDGLTPGAYQVKVVGSGSASHNILGSAYTQTGDPDHFSVTSATSNNNLSDLPIVLGPGDVFLNADFGYQPTTAALGSIGDFVWLDANASGTATADPGEFGIANVTLALIRDLNGNGTWDVGEPIVARTITGANGAYLFSGLPLGDAADGDATDADYLVWVNDTYNILAQPRQTYDENGIISPNISAATLSSGVSSVTDQDFSYAPASQPDPSTAVIGDKIWFDGNRNGILDASEHGIPAVLMELVDSLGRVIALTLTDASGSYFFGGLSPTATYSVRVAAANALPGRPLVGLVNTFDPNGGNDGISLINLGAVGNDGNGDPDGVKNGLNLGQDFGYGPPSGAANQGSIGNLVWLDVNANGVRDAAEPGIQGVTLDLYRDLNRNGQRDTGEPLVSTTTTDSAGAYLFTGLPLTDGIFDPLIFATDPDASYVVDVSDRSGVLQGYWHSLGTAGINNNSQTDPVGITLTSTNPNMPTADFGYYVEPASVGNYLWVDVNGNGLQDDGSTGIANVIVVLTITYPDNTVIILKTTTDSNGNYTFGNLLLDEDNNQGVGGVMPAFVISVPAGQPQLAGYSRTYVGVGNDPEIDSNNLDGTPAYPVKGVSNVISYDFGIYPSNQLYSLGNRVWLDVNNDGAVNPGEASLADVKVELLDATGLLVYATAFTDASGYYRFDGLLPGSYFIRIAAENWTGITGSPGGSLDGTSPLAGQVSSSGNASAIQTSGTLAVNGIDHGLDSATPATTGITSRVVTLGVGNQPLAEVDAGASGAGAYGTNGDVLDNLALDFGFFSPVAIGDSVWNDANNNGIKDLTEAGIDGVTLLLDRDLNGDGDFLDAGEGAVATTVTSGGGFYNFTNLLPGTYQVRIPVPPAGYGRSSTVTDNADNSEDNDDNGTQAAAGGVTFSPAIVLTSGGEPGTAVDGSDTNTDSTIDFGFFDAGSLGNLVFADLNNDGFFNGADTGIDGVTVVLDRDINGDGDFVDSNETGYATTITSGGGLYHFTDLPAGDYQVRIPIPSVTFPVSSSTTVTTDNQVNNDDNGTQSGGSGTATISPVISIATGENDPTIDFGFWKSGSIGNLVWFDRNNDGLYAAAGIDNIPGNGDDETGFSGVAVVLDYDINNDGDFADAGETGSATTSTNSSGNYTFGNLLPGNYQVRIPNPPSWPGLSSVNFTTDNQVDNDNNGTQPVFGGPATSPEINLSPGEDDLTIDFSFTCHATWEEWKILNPLGGQNGFSDNPEGDRRDNLLEYALSGAPSSGVGDGFCIRPSPTAIGTLEGVFLMPKGAFSNVKYYLEYTDVLGNPTNWTSTLLTGGGNLELLPYDLCTRQAIIPDLETLTGFLSGKGFVRLRVELDEDGGGTTDYPSRTETEGWTETPLEMCCRTYNNPYLRCAAFTGTVASVSGQAIAFTGEALETLLSPGVSYYLEVTSGDNAGQRFDLVSASGSSVILATDNDLYSASSPFNTVTGAPPANLAGDKVIIRRHWTLGEMFPPSGFGANADRSIADQVQLFANGQWIIYWLYNDGTNPARWVKTGDNTYADQGASVIPPGQGLFFNNRTAATSLLAYGEVRANDFVRPLAPGSNLIAGGYPADQSPTATAGREMTAAAGFFGSRDIATADTFYVWDGDTTPGASGYSSYFFNDNAPRLPSVIKWVKVGDSSLLPRGAETLLKGDASVFLRSKNGLTGYTVPTPWVP